VRSAPGRKVFGIGLSRTGTRSLAAALKLLGLRTLHFPADPLTRRQIAAYHADPAAPLRLTVMDAHDAAVDTPVAACFAGLDRAYPGARFVYTTRPLADWLRSCEAYWGALFHPQLENPTIDPALLAYMRAVNRAMYGVERFDRARFTAARERHDRAVRAWFRDRPGRLLVLPLCEGAGWEPLCDFLGRAAPGLPFPHHNQAPRVPSLPEAAGLG